MSVTLRHLVDAARSRIRELAPHEARPLLDLPTPFVDVREPEEFAESHIPGAINIPRGLLEFEVDGHPRIRGRDWQDLSHRGRPLVVYCQSGGRSALAAESLQRLGFAAPLSLAGGLLEWEDLGLPVARPGLRLAVSR